MVNNTFHPPMTRIIINLIISPTVDYHKLYNRAIKQQGHVPHMVSLAGETTLEMDTSEAKLGNPSFCYSCTSLLHIAFAFNMMLRCIDHQSSFYWLHLKSHGSAIYFSLFHTLTLYIASPGLHGVTRIEDEYDWEEYSLLFMLLNLIKFHNFKS